MMIFIGICHGESRIVPSLGELFDDFEGVVTADEPAASSGRLELLFETEGIQCRQQL
jgi:hypothetical protein